MQKALPKLLITNKKMLVTLLYILFFISCLVLVATILLQPGKADAGALFTSNISSTAFGPRGTQSVLSRITIGAAISFMLTALLLAMPAITGNVSVLNSTTGSATETAAPIADTNTNAIPQAQADTITNLNINTTPATENNSVTGNVNAAGNANTAPKNNTSANPNNAAKTNANK
jgi:preprotein translocase subunit SecG